MLQEAYEQLPPSRALVPLKSPGRPSLYTPAVAVEILDRLAAGETLNRICKDKHLPAESTIRLWVMEDRPAGFAAKYTRARTLAYLSMADELVELSDDSSRDWKSGENDDDPPIFNGEAVARSRLRIDTRKWVLAKMLPKVFGDKVLHDHEHSGTITHRQEDWLKQLK